jgi:hypothetical protein
MKENIFIESDLFSLVQKDITIIIKHATEGEKESVVTNIKLGIKPTKKKGTDFYCEIVFSELMKIRRMFEKCQFCIDMMQKEGRKKRIEQNLLELYISNYHIYITAIYDNIFRLVHAVLMSGMDPRDISQKNTINNVFIHGTKIENALKKVYKNIDKIIMYRNEIVHENDYDFMFNYFDPSTYSYFQMTEIQNMRSVNEQFFSIIDYKMKINIKKTSDIFQENLVKYVNDITQVENELLHIYVNSIYRNKTMSCYIKKT